MRALILQAPGGFDKVAVAERREPVPGKGEVLLRVRASSINYHDYVVAKGYLPVADGRVLMSDGAGEVVASGPGANLFAPGDRVVSTYYPGWLAGQPTPDLMKIKPGETVDGYGSEYVAVPESWVTAMPAGYSFTEAATLTCAGLTAWRGVVIEGRVKPGDVVLVQGTGGVSIFALQFAKAAGASVIATSSSEEKLEKLRKLGADHVINYRELPEWGTRAKELTGGRGVDVVIEVGGAGTLMQSLMACRMNGHISLIGVLSGMSGEIPTAYAFVNQITIRGMAVGCRADQEDMVRGVAAANIKPIIDSVFPLEEATRAWQRQEAHQHFGKICLEF